jgi:hypothetical protein
MLKLATEAQFEQPVGLWATPTDQQSAFASA